MSDSSGRSPPASRNSTREMSATAPPPTPLNSATICGIAVIFTLRALGIPIAVPTTTPAAIRPQSPIRSSSSVADQRDAHPGGGDQVAPHRRARSPDHAQAADEQREARRCRAG